MLAVGRVMFISAFKLKWVLFQPAKQNVHILLKTIRCVIAEDTVFMSGLAAAAWLHQMERRLAFFSYCFQGGMLVEVENLTKLGEITGISAICVFSLHSTLSLSFFVMTNFQYSWIVLDSGKCLDACLCSLVQYIWLHRDTIVESYIGQNRTTFVMGFGGSGRFCRRRDVSAFDQ